MTSRSRASGVLFFAITLAALLGVVITASLGRWQLGRAAEKLEYEQTLASRAAQPALDSVSLVRAVTEAALQSLLHRSVELEGLWLPEHTVYLDNRQMYGRPGFFVVTPLQLRDTRAVVLVQRGWVPRNFQDRAQVPDVVTPPGLVTVKGRVAAAPSRLYEFSTGDRAQGSSRIRQNLDLAAFRASTQLPFLDFSVVQLGDPSEGMQRDWPVVSSGVDKHYGYAFQWFGLCGLIAVLYVWFQIIRRFIRPRREHSA